VSIPPLNQLAISATLHCLTGCAMAAVAGVFGTAVLVGELIG
jgi:hypothetical protein